MSKDEIKDSQDEAIQLIIEYGILAVSLFHGDKEAGLQRFIEEDLPEELVPVSKCHRQYIIQQIRNVCDMSAPKEEQR